jgi:hypothetical protein
MVSTLGKNMKKYAELSYQRLVVALPSKMTAADMRDYTALVSKVCDKCQVSGVLSICVVCQPSTVILSDSRHVVPLLVESQTERPLNAG